jgi:hypothetical protein
LISLALVRHIHQSIPIKKHIIAATIPIEIPTTEIRRFLSLLLILLLLFQISRGLFLSLGLLFFFTFYLFMCDRRNYNRPDSNLQGVESEEGDSRIVLESYLTQDNPGF